MKTLFSPFFFLFAWLAMALTVFFTPRRSFPMVVDPLPRGDVYGTSSTKLRTNPVQRVGVIDLGARVRYMNEVYTQGAADGTLGDVLHLPPLPTGAQILAHLCQVTNSAGNAAATLALGKTGAATALLAATAITDAGTRACTPPADGAADVTLADSEELIATNAGAAIKAGQVIRFRIAFVENS
jgi:hypothetical protein